MPTSPPPDDAAAGRLRLFVGGDPDLVARWRPVLEVVADPDRIRHVGGHGAGYTDKLLVNLLWFGQAVATAEALLTGHRAGLDLAVLREVPAVSPASSEFIRRDPPTENSSPSRSSRSEPTYGCAPDPAGLGTAPLPGPVLSVLPDRTAQVAG